MAYSHVFVWYVYICFLVLFFVISVNAEQNCSTYSASDFDNYWDAVSKCGQCNIDDGCGFCLSTLTCMKGTNEGPSNGVPCPSWTFSQETCPETPNCEASTTCSSCAVQVVPTPMSHVLCIYIENISLHPYSFFLI